MDKQQAVPANYLVIASDLRPFDGPPMKASEVFELMMRHECWEFGNSAPFRGKMVPGDQLFIYLGGDHARYVAGDAEIAGDIVAIDDDSPVTFNRSQVPFFTWRAPLSKIQVYPPGRLGLDFLTELSFFTSSTVERKHIGLLLRGGVRVLTETDAAMIQSAAASESKN